MSDTTVKDKLRAWIISKNPGIDTGALTNQTALITQKYVSSVQMLDLILYIESLGAVDLDPEKLNPQSFASIDVIYQTFFT